MPQSILDIDLETFSEVPIANGTHRYAEKAEIMLTAWGIDGGSVSVVDEANGEKRPAELREARRARFMEDAWQRDPADASTHLRGGGRTRILREGAVFEQAGIGFSDVSGTRLPPAATAARPELEGAHWRAVGVSLVFHPRNPYLPTTHANVRHFRAQRDGETVAWWFGGGFDLTPYYVHDEDVLHWHRVARALCEPFGGEARYDAHTQSAIDAQVFGAPTYVVADEMFWGQDRLDFVTQALKG